MDDLTVAVLGTGLMGEPIARNLLRSGIGVHAWNRTRAKAEPLAADGAVVRDRAAEAVEGADVVLTMLLDGDAVQRVMTEALPAMSPGAIWAQMSTVGAEPADRLAALAREHGVPFADCPVLGTRKPAEDGTLLVLAPETFDERLGRIFDAVGSRTLRVGSGTAPSRMKLVVNSWVLALTAAVGEVNALAEAFGLDPGLFLDAIAGGPLDSGYARAKSALIAGGELPPSFRATAALKDADLVTNAARDAGTHLRVAEAVRDQFRRAIELGHGDQDMAAVYFATQG